MTGNLWWPIIWERIVETVVEPPIVALLAWLRSRGI